MIRLHLELDEKAWEKLMWALEHEEPLPPTKNPKVLEWVRNLNNPEKYKEELNELKQFLKKAMETEGFNKKGI
jgi:hypothetical protein